jgi:hypothetical protein
LKHLNVAALPAGSSEIIMHELSALLDKSAKNILACVPWSEYNYQPVVEFVLAYNEAAVFLKYYVSESAVRAANSRINSNVWEDSCVEFFISFDDAPGYYNLEFNCIGTACAGYGATKNNRQLLSPQLVSQIKYQSVIGNRQQEGSIHWELTIVIPKNIFCFTEIGAFKGKRCRVNFYKCGDHLPVPHFVSWANIVWPQPEFHLPDFFGSLQFI